MKLGHKLLLKTVAKGVERPQQLAKLQSLGCDALQGYMFARRWSPRPRSRS